MHVVVMGAGPAGLAAAYAVARRGHRAAVLEADAQVGGISRTVEYRGNLFDLGGHRFFTKFDEVMDLWQEVLGPELLVRPRLSRIFYRGRFFDYPLRASNALRNLGLLEAGRCMASYTAARLRPEAEAATLEDWVTQRFGRRLFEIFFRTYTEKVWGIPCTEIGAEWAGQRIKNLSLGAAIADALLGRFRKGAIASLIERFHYPRRGPGMMYERMAQRVREMGSGVELGHRVERVRLDGGRVRAVSGRRRDGSAWEVAGEAFVSSIPLTELVRVLEPAAPAEVLAAARALTYRHLLTVDLMVNRADLFPDNWIYVHSPELTVGRIQNFGNWSPEMVATPGTSALGLEYFVSDGDPLWNAPDDELVRFGTHELERTGLLRGARVFDGTVVRVPRAYPVYRVGYRQHLDVLERYVRSIPNLHVVGRYGMFKYNNADHSILTALLAVENILDGATHDLWAVNTDSEYHEIRRESGGRARAA